MRHTIGAALVSAGILLTPPAFAREISVEITNLTNSFYFTPLLVAAHPAGTHLFEPGASASAHLQAMAEGGDISGLIGDVEALGGVHDADPAGGLLAPGASATATLDVHQWRRQRLSIVAMLLPTNDGFVGLDALRFPLLPGRHTFFVPGYDAGTEANDEIINGGGAPGVPGIPADPGGNSGVGGTGAAGPDHNQSVHVHRGALGDADPGGGPSDLDRAVHRWQNPVARVVVTVGK
jgi:hypothetical protein